MAGGHMKYRTLSRSSAHRQALLRNLVTSLLKHESITTTWHKAKEAQRLAEKLVTLGKRNTEAAKNRAKAILYEPSLLPKLFGPLSTRYALRPGGYTRVLRLEPESEDQAPSAILELVDSPRDTRFALTARTLAHQRAQSLPANDVTQGNVVKVTRFRQNGEEELEALTRRFEELEVRREEAKVRLVEDEERVEVERRRGVSGKSAGLRAKVRREEKGNAEWKNWVLDEGRAERKRRVYNGVERSRI